jgi:hypothetical protein
MSAAITGLCILAGYLIVITGLLILVAWALERADVDDPDTEADLAYFQQMNSERKRDELRETESYDEALTLHTYDAIDRIEQASVTPIRKGRVIPVEFPQQREGGSAS